jgi:hypothetical protein
MVDRGVPPRESVDFRGLCLTDGGLGTIPSSSDAELARDRACECRDTCEGCEWSALCLRSEAVDLLACSFGVVGLDSGIGGGSQPNGTWGDGRGSTSGREAVEVGMAAAILGDS